MNLPFRRSRSTSSARRTALAALLAAAFPLLAASGTKPPATTRVSVSEAGVQGTNGSRFPSISANGRFVAFQSSADNLVDGDSNTSTDVFVRDLKTGRNTRVSVDTNGNQVGEGGGAPSISANGRYVAFESAAGEIVPGKIISRRDIILRDLKAGTTTLVSVDSEGNQANASSSMPHISANGRFVVFQSEATNLVPGDDNKREDVFVRDIRAGTTVRASVDSAGNQSVGGGAYPAISADGRFVAFNSSGNDLVPMDTAGVIDIFVKDLKTGLTTRASVASNGQESDGEGYNPTISANGRFVAFVSHASNLVSFNLMSLDQIYLHDTRTGETTRISGFTRDVEGDGPADYPCITPNGRFVAYSSSAANLGPPDSNSSYDVYVHDVRAGVNVRASVDSLGNQANGNSDSASISANGRLVAFPSGADNLVPGDDGGYEDIFVRALK